MQAIVYTTNTGSTEQYARLLGQEIARPVYSLAEAGSCLPAGAQIIYLGWLMAGKVQGYRKAAKRYSVAAVCAVGMGQTGTQQDAVRQKNGIPTAAALFTLQGNFAVERLHGVYRLMMDIMVKTAGKGLSEKPNRTAEEEDMLQMMLHGGERVKKENLANLLIWYRKQE